MMLFMIAETPIRSDRIIVLGEILEKLGAEKGDTIRWYVNKKGKVELEINKNELNVKEVAEDLGMSVEELTKELDEARAEIRKGKSFKGDVDALAKEIGL